MRPGRLGRKGFSDRKVRRVRLDPPVRQGQLVRPAMLAARGRKGLPGRLGRRGQRVRLEVRGRKGLLAG